MSPIFLYGAALIVFAHGLIHLMGFVSYLRLATIAELPYKTTLLNGAWNIGDSGIRLFGLLWLLVAIGYAIAAYGLAAQQNWWQAALVVVTLSSLVLTVLDYQVAYAGVVVNVVILALLVVTPLFARG